MTTAEGPLDDLNVGAEDLWESGPPLETFAELRSKCPVHWSGPPGRQDMPGWWSITRADDIEEISRDWETWSSGINGVDQLENETIYTMENKTFINMDPPRHDVMKALFLPRFSPRRIAKDEPWVREIVERVFDGLEGRESIDLVEDVARPIVARVIHTICGIPEEEDAKWSAYMNRYMAREDPGYNPGGLDEYVNEFVPFLVEEASKLADRARENPSEDGGANLIDIMINGKVDGVPLTDEEIAMNLLLVLAAGNDSTKATYSNAMKALMNDPEQRQLLIDDPELVSGAVEEALRMFPPFLSFCRTAKDDTEFGGQEIKAGQKVSLWYSSSNRDESRYEDPDTFDVRRNPEHHAFGGGGKHFCLGAHLARLELRLMIAESVKRYPHMRINGETKMASSYTLNLHTTLPVSLNG